MSVAVGRKADHWKQSYRKPVAHCYGVEPVSCAAAAQQAEVSARKLGRMLIPFFFFTHCSRNLGLCLLCLN
jgi:cytochrome oxidase Cu insertion factor (SCO1/SenC/PrrC family)